MLQSPSYLIVGAGYLGGALARALVQSSQAATVLRRRAEPIEGAQLIQADLARPETLKDLPLCTHLVYAAAADSSSEAAYRSIYVDGLRNILQALELRGCTPRVFYTSSTSVYAADDGSEVDERSGIIAQKGLGAIIAEGERWLLAGPWTTTIVRFGGIYGPQRTYFLRRVWERKEVLFEGPPLYTNRIHQADCVGMLMHLMGDKGLKGGIYNGVDCDAADRNSVIRWMAEELGIPIEELSVSADRSLVSHRGQNACSIKRSWRPVIATFSRPFARAIAPS